MCTLYRPPFTLEACGPQVGHACGARSASSLVRADLARRGLDPAQFIFRDHELAERKIVEACVYVPFVQQV